VIGVGDIFDPDIVYAGKGSLAVSLYIYETGDVCKFTVLNDDMFYSAGGFAADADA
jgi:hypothetical protein